MAIDFNTITGNLFNRWGKMLGGDNQAQASVNATLTARVVSLNGQFAAADAQVLQQNANNLMNMQSQYQGTPQAIMTSYTSMMQNTLIAMVVDDFVANGNNAGGGVVSSNPTFLQSLNYLVGQMNFGGYANTAWLRRPTIQASAAYPTGAGVAGGANVGNGTYIVSMIDWDGYPLDYALQETITATCTGDGYPGGNATAGSEPFSAAGQTSAASIYSWNYGNVGVGSGSTVQLTTLDTTKTSGLVLTDGNFEVWSGGTPALTNWNIGVGVPGTTVVRGNTPYLGTYDLWIVGDGSELTKLRQAVTLLPNTVYAVNAYMHTDGSVAAGSIEMRLVTAATPTASASTVVNNDAGSPNAIVQDVTALSSSFAPVSGFFQTPAILPTDLYFEFFVNTAITNTERVNIDCVGIIEAVQQYPGGPWEAMFTGSVDFATGDSFTAIITNAPPGGASLYASFPWQLSRFFGLPSLNNGVGLKFPSSTSTSSGEIPNTLIG